MGSSGVAGIAIALAGGLATTLLVRVLFGPGSAQTRSSVKGLLLGVIRLLGDNLADYITILVFLASTGAWGLVAHELGLPHSVLAYDQWLFRPVIYLKWKHQAQFAPWYSAALNGHFDSQGLEVTFEEGGISAERSPLRAIAEDPAGTAAFGVTGALDVIKARSEGLPVTAVLATLQSPPERWFFRCPPGSDAAIDFVGKSVGVSHRPWGTSLVLDLWLAKSGLNRFRVRKPYHQFVEIDREERRRLYGGFIVEVTARETDLDSAAPFLRGDVDIWEGYGPNELLYAGEQIGDDRLCSLDPDTNFGIPAYGDVIVVNERFLRAHRDVVVRVLGAYLAGLEFVLEDSNRTEALDHVSEFAGASSEWNREHQDRMLTTLLPLTSAAESGHDLGGMSSARWEELAGQMYSAGLTSRLVSAGELADFDVGVEAHVLAHSILSRFESD